MGPFKILSDWLYRNSTNEMMSSAKCFHSLALPSLSNGNVGELVGSSRKRVSWYRSLHFVCGRELVNLGIIFISCTVLFCDGTSFFIFTS